MNDRSLREHLVELLEGGSAHSRVDEIVNGFPSSKCAVLIDGYSNSAWRLLEHVRIAQWDILEFSRDASHVSPEFPVGYWPDSEVDPTEADWRDTASNLLSDLNSMIALVRDPAIDLFAPIEHGNGQTILREAMLVADHNAYHLGQLLLLQRTLEGQQD